MMNSGSSVPSNTWHASRTSDCSDVLLLAQRQRRASSTVAREMGEFGAGHEGTSHMEMEKERGYRLAAGRGPEGAAMGDAKGRARAPRHAGRVGRNWKTVSHAIAPAAALQLETDGQDTTTLET